MSAVRAKGAKSESGFGSGFRARRLPTRDDAIRTRWTRMRGARMGESETDVHSHYHVGSTGSTCGSDRVDRGVLDRIAAGAGGPHVVVSPFRPRGIPRAFWGKLTNPCADVAARGRSAGRREGQGGERRGPAPRRRAISRRGQPGRAPAIRAPRVAGHVRALAADAIDARAEVFDLGGRRVLSRTVVNAAPAVRRFQLEEGDLAAGLYWLRVIHGRRQHVSKFVVLR